MATLIDKISTETNNRIGAFRNRFGGYDMGLNVNNHQIVTNIPLNWVNNDINMI